MSESIPISQSISGKTKHDVHPPLIVAGKYLDSERLALVDRANCYLKIYNDVTGNLKDVYQLDDQPADICKGTRTNEIYMSFTRADSSDLKQFRIEPSKPLQLLHSIQTHNRSRAVDIFDDGHLVINTYKTIDVIDRKGAVTKSINDNTTIRTATYMSTGQLGISCLVMVPFLLSVTLTQELSPARICGRAVLKSRVE